MRTDTCYICTFADLQLEDLREDDFARIAGYYGNKHSPNLPRYSI
jgi:hypothetical protein